MHATPGVLVIDDEVLIADYFVTVLEEHGIPVVGNAISAAEAVSLFETHRPEVLVCDVQLAGDDGIALAAELSARHAVQIVFVSGGADQSMIERMLAVRGATFVPKPTTASTIVTAVRTALARASRSRELE